MEVCFVFRARVFLRKYLERCQCCQRVRSLYYWIESCSLSQIWGWVPWLATLNVNHDRSLVSSSTVTNRDSWGPQPVGGTLQNIIRDRNQRPYTLSLSTHYSWPSQLSFNVYDNRIFFTSFHSIFILTIPSPKNSPCRKNSAQYLFPCLFSTT